MSSDPKRCEWEISEYEGETTQCEEFSVDDSGLCEFHKMMIKIRESQAARTERLQVILNNMPSENDNN